MVNFKLYGCNTTLENHKEHFNSQYWLVHFIMDMHRHEPKMLPKFVYSCHFNIHTQLGRGDGSPKIKPVVNVLLKTVQVPRPRNKTISQRDNFLDSKWNFEQEWAVVVAQLVKRSLSTTEICRSNPVIGQILSTNCILVKTKIKKKSPGMAQF